MFVWVGDSKKYPQQTEKNELFINTSFCNYAGWHCYK